jgi:hypothetical protein
MEGEKGLTTWALVIYATISLVVSGMVILRDFAPADRLAKRLTSGSKNLGHFGGCSEGEYRIST